MPHSSAVNETLSGPTYDIDGGQQLIAGCVTQMGKQARSMGRPCDVKGWQIAPHIAKSIERHASKRTPSSRFRGSAQREKCDKRGD